MIITCEFLTSRYMAKATHHEPEWPPHPARLFYALVSALHVFRSEENGSGDVEERKALEWLEALGHPQVLAAPGTQIRARRVVTHHVPANDPDNVSDKQARAGGRKPDHLPEHRGKSERQFPTLLLSDKTNRVYYCWPGVTPDEGQRASLLRLFDRVSYLGHSSSLIALCLSADNAVLPSDDLIRWGSAPSDRGGIPLRSFSKNLLQLLEQVYEPNEFSQQNYRLPHESVPYAQAPARDESASNLAASHFGEHWVVYRFPDWVRIPTPAVLKALVSGHQPAPAFLLCSARAAPKQRAFATIKGRVSINSLGPSGNARSRLKASASLWLIPNSRKRSRVTENFFDLELAASSAPPASRKGKAKSASALLKLCNASRDSFQQRTCASLWTSMTRPTMVQTIPLAPCELA